MSLEGKNRGYQPKIDIENYAHLSLASVIHQFNRRTLTLFYFMLLL
jgi:hypothetical protein